MADIEWITKATLLQERFNHREMKDFFTKNGEKIEYVDMFWFVDLYNRLNMYGKPPHAPGVYMWLNVVKQIGYIGSSKDLFRRRAEFLNLRTEYGNGNKTLSNDRNEHAEDFVFLILEYVENPQILKTREQFYITKYNTLTEGYNTNSSKSSDTKANKDIQNISNKDGRKVIHLHFLNTDEHYYFGSMASIYDYYDSDTLGITYKALRNCNLSADNPFKNDVCIIRRGVLLPKKSGRGTSLKSLYEHKTENTAEN